MVATAALAPTDAAPACAVAIGRALADDAVVAVVARAPDAEAHNALVADAEAHVVVATAALAPVAELSCAPSANAPGRAAAACSFHSVAARAHGRSVGAGVRRVPGRAGAGAGAEAHEVVVAAAARIFLGMARATPRNILTSLCSVTIGTKRVTF